MGKGGPPEEVAKAKNSAPTLPSFAGVHARRAGAHGAGPGRRNRRRHVHVRDALYHQLHLQLPLLSSPASRLLEHAESRLLSAWQLGHGVPR